jgi:3-hydroxyacyl-CoA dehydrogenase/enoyl-CoA hydratase/3-hydroxybutyryl-CoA epimerase
VHSPAGLQIWPPANAIYRRETHDNYPAAKAILTSVYEGLQLPMDLALKVESRHFAKDPAIQGSGGDDPHAVRLDGRAEQGRPPAAGRAASTSRRSASSARASWAPGIAYVSANAGLDVVLIDRDVEAAEKGKAHSHKLMTDQVMKGRAKTADRDALLARITPSADYGDLADCDLVIEAVFEDPKVKAEVIGKVEAAIRPDCIFASNTSTLPISGLAKNSKNAGSSSASISSRRSRR